MDARPYALNKILPCTKTFNLHTRGATATSSTIERNFYYAHDPDADEYSMYGGKIPNNCKVGSDVDIMITWGVIIANISGSDKVVRIVPSYSYLRNGQVLQALVTMPATLITVPDSEAVKTIHTSKIATLTGLAANDIIAVRVLRDADHVDDTWTEDVLISFDVFGKYIANKIGVV